MKKTTGRESRLCIRVLKKKKIVFLTVAAAMMAAGSITAGAALTPEDMELPVVLAGGEIIDQPWYVTVEGEHVAIVSTREEAKQVVKEVATQYKNEETIDVEVQEETDAREMSLKNGAQKPDILSVTEAAGKIVEEEELTVVTTEVVTEEEPIEFDKVEKSSDELYIGETKVVEKGEDGKKNVTKKVRKENGQVVKEEIQKETVVEEPKEKVVLVGTKQPEILEESETGQSETGEILQSEATDGEFQIGGGQLKAPLSSLRVTSSFGPRWGRTHRGVDLGMESGAPIYAADSGTVIFSDWNGSYGNLVKLDHGNGMVTYYAHCSELLVSQGQNVSKGEVIARVGSTGNSTGPHLHFEVLMDGNNVNPMNYL